MRISDWSSDVCSSDLPHGIPRREDRRVAAMYGDAAISFDGEGTCVDEREDRAVVQHDLRRSTRRLAPLTGIERRAIAFLNSKRNDLADAGGIGRASCRVRGCQDV